MYYKTVKQRLTTLLKSGWFQNERAFTALEALLVLVVCGVIVLTGYAVYAKASRSSSYASLPAKTPHELSEAHTAFGFAVLKQVYASGADENTVISPTSIHYALSMTREGALGDTKQAMTKALQLSQLAGGTDTIAAKSRESLEGFKKPGQGVELRIANSVWTDKRFPVRPTFVEVLSKYYDAQAQSLDFADPAAPTRINDWVSEKTRGKISTVIDKTAGSSMVIVNATYFIGNWLNDFKESQTKNATFTKTDGTTYQTPLMHRYGDMPYYETANLQAVKLPYGEVAAVESPRYSMYVFLPQDIKKFVGTLNVSTWSSYVEKFKSVEGELLLPKFTTAYSQYLKQPLTQLGMGKVFGRTAEFNGISPGAYVDDVIHKTYLDVNEKGTEAVAVTAQISAGAVEGADQPKPFRMEVNRPFFVAIQDHHTGELIFTGVITAPHSR